MREGPIRLARYLENANQFSIHDSRFESCFGVSCILTKKVGKIKYYCPKFQNFHIEVTLGGGELSFTEGL